MGSKGAYHLQSKSKYRPSRDILERIINRNGQNTMPRNSSRNTKVPNLISSSTSEKETTFTNKDNSFRNTLKRQPKKPASPTASKYDTKRSFPYLLRDSDFRGTIIAIIS